VEQAAAALAAIDDLIAQSVTVIVVPDAAVAVHWGHRNADAFPDGRLHIDLRGAEPGSWLRPIEALGRLLGYLDEPPDDDLDTMAARYRSLLAGRRMLLILAHARDAAQVRPLLPGTSDCVVLVTSPNRLTGLLAQNGAKRID
jgi:hypothetical protein